MCSTKLTLPKLGGIAVFMLYNRLHAEGWVFHLCTEKQQLCLILVLRAIGPLSPKEFCVGARRAVPGQHEGRLEAPQSCGVSASQLFPSLLVSSHARLCAPAGNSSAALTSALARGLLKQGDGFRDGVWPSTCLLCFLGPWRAGEESSAVGSVVCSHCEPAVLPWAHTPTQPESSAILLLMGLAPLKAVCEGIVCNHSKRNIIQRLFRPQKKRQSRVIIEDSPLTRASLLFVCVGLIRATNGAGGGAH